MWEDMYLAEVLVKGRKDGTCERSEQTFLLAPPQLLASRKLASGASEKNCDYYSFSLLRGTPVAKQTRT